MSGIKGTTQAEPDVEIGVLEEYAREGQPREGGDLVRKLKLEIKERLRVNHVGELARQV
jgi:hypothetical protein